MNVLLQNYISRILCVLVALYRSPSQSHNEFSSFITSSESTLQVKTLRKPFLTMVLRDFNAKNKLWFDQENTPYEGSILNDLMAQYGLTQIIHEPTHILESSVSCIDLISTSTSLLHFTQLPIREFIRHCIQTAITKQFFPILI